MEGLKVGWRKEGVEGEVIFTSESDVVRLELNKEKKMCQYLFSSV